MSFGGSDITCFSGGSRRYFSGCEVTFLNVLSNDTGVDCEPSTNDGVLDSPRVDGGYFISGFLDIRNLPERAPVAPVVPIVM